MILVWISGYILSVVFRSAGDAKFLIFISTVSMIVFKIVFAYVFSFS